MPLIASVLALFGHGSGRIFKLSKRYGIRIVPGISLGTGCGSSPPLATGVMRRPILKAIAASKANNSVHIDDLAQDVQGSKQFVADNLIAAGDAFVDAAVAKGLEVSSKSVLITSCPKLSAAIVKHFRRTWNVELSVAVQGEHLGLAKVHGTKGSAFQLIGKRFKKASQRHGRTKWLAKQDRQRPLTVGPSSPLAAWGLTRAMLLLPSTSGESSIRWNLWYRFCVPFWSCGAKRAMSSDKASALRGITLTRSSRRCTPIGTGLSSGAR